MRVPFRSTGAVRALAKRVADPYIDAVCGVSFAIGRGETLGGVGESGSGKSTIARAIMGLARVHSGSVRFDGRGLTTLGRRGYSHVARDVALMF